MIVVQLVFFAFFVVTFSYTRRIVVVARDLLFSLVFKHK